MAYSKTDWNTGDTITEELLDKIQQGIYENSINLDTKAIGWRNTVENDDWNNIDTAGMYRGSTATGRVSLHAPFDDGGLYGVLVLKARPEGNIGATTQIAWLIDHPNNNIKIRMLPSTAADKTEWTPWASNTEDIGARIDNLSQIIASNNASLPYTKVMRWGLFDNVILPSNYSNYKVKHVVIGDGKIFAGIDYSTTNPYRIIVKQLTSRLDTLSGAETAYDIQMVDYEYNNTTISASGNMGAFRDTGNKIIYIAHMAYYNGYLYVALRAGGNPSNTSAPNSLLAVIDTSNMQTTKLFAGADRICTLTIDTTMSIPMLIVGERRGGFSIYDITDPALPVKKVSIAASSSSVEFQHSCTYTDNDSNHYIAFGNYVSGAIGYLVTIENSNITLTEAWKWDSTQLQQVGENLNCFAVAVRWPYAYVTISPINSSRQNGDLTMGIATLDLSNLTQGVPQFLGFSRIPEKDCGDWAVRVSYTKNTSNVYQYEYVATGDPHPDFIRIIGNNIYINNQNKGIAVFNIVDDKLVYKGLVALGVWPRYFEAYSQPVSVSAGDTRYMIVSVAGGEYDYISDKTAEVTAVTMPLMR